MRPSPTSERPRPLQTAWELWLVRQLSRLGIRLAPRLVVWTVGALVVGGCLLVAAAVTAWGDAAVTNVRAGPGFFGTEPPGLTNATHLVFLASIPLILMSLVTVVHAVGLRSPEPSIMRADREVWTALALGARHVLLTHVAVPRIPLLVIVLTPPVVVGTLGNLTTAERQLVLILVSAAVVLELVHLATSARRLTRPLREGERVLPRALAAVVGAAVIGVGAGLVLRTVVPLLGLDSSETAPAASVARFLTDRPAAVLAVLAVVAAATLLGIVRLCAGRRSFPTTAAQARPTVMSRQPRAPWSAPVAGPGQLAGAWAAPEVRLVVVVVAAVLAARPPLTGLAADLVPIIAVTTMMAFSVTRVAPWGLISSLARLRHHVELGAEPRRHSRQLLLLAVLAVLPVAVPLSFVVVLGGRGPVHAAGLLLLPVAAFVLADAFVAQPGARLTERRLLILALAQSVTTICGWFLFAVHPAAGWAAVLLLMGVHRWLSIHRQLIWRPKTRW